MYRRGGVSELRREEKKKKKKKTYRFDCSDISEESLLFIIWIFLLKWNEWFENCLYHFRAVLWIY